MTHILHPAVTIFHAQEKEDYKMAKTVLLQYKQQGRPIHLTETRSVRSQFQPIESQSSSL